MEGVPTKKKLSFQTKTDTGAWWLLLSLGEFYPRASSLITVLHVENN